MLALLPAIVMLAAVPVSLPMQLEVRDAIATAAPAGGSTAVSMLLTNPTSQTMVLTGATTPMAGQTLLQTYVQGPDGYVQIQPMSRLSIPAGKAALLAEGVTEIQLINLTTQLQPGLELPLTLKFEDGATRVIRLQVKGNQ